MKRILTLIVVIAICLTGCSSGDYVSKRDYDELVARVETLEEQLENINSVSNTGESVITSTDNGAGMPSNDTDYSYSLKEMSIEEIKDVIVKYLENLPYDGESQDEYRAMLGAEPLGYDEYDLWYKFYDGPAEYGGDDHFCSLEVRDATINEDGTISLKSVSYLQGRELHMQWVISDYDRATELFDLLEEYLRTQDFENLEAHREEPSWHIHYTYKGENGLVINNENLLAMTWYKGKSNYVFDIRKRF